MYVFSVALTHNNLLFRFRNVSFCLLHTLPQLDHTTVLLQVQSIQIIVDGNGNGTEQS